MSPDELSQAVNLSPSRLHELFKYETGTSPVKYLKALRMEHARELLETSFLSVKEIRARVGEGDESNFTRAFKRAFGDTPSQYRARRSAAPSAAAEAAPHEPPAPAGCDSRAEKARPGPPLGPTADESAAAKVWELLLRLQAATPRDSRPKLTFRPARRPVRRAVQRPAGERVSTPLIFRPAASFETARGRRVLWPHYRKLRRLGPTSVQQPSLHKSARLPSWRLFLPPMSTLMFLP